MTRNLLPRFIYFLFLFSLLLTGCNNKPGNSETLKEHGKEFKPTVASLRNYRTPEWFRNAKFGIYMHWGVYSVAEMGEWYARKLYIQGTPEYEHHLKTYGHPSKFGYKDFIPLWKAENFDPDKLITLFKKAGARYFTPVAVHHDNFDLWNSKYHKWNAVNMGPKKDIIGMWREAVLKQGLRFGVTTHLSRSYSWLNVANQADTSGPFKGIPYDGDNPKYDDFYFPKHKDIDPRAPENAPQWWRDEWAKRIEDLIDNYNPDLLYFDCAIPFRGDDNGRTGLKVISHYYNHNMEVHHGNLEGVMTIKERPFQGLYVDGVTTLDYERGKACSIRKEPWQTDDSMGPWGYRKGAKYMSTDALIDKFIDIVSKNGNLLLNVPIKADGTLDKEATTILEEMGEWMDLNGEAIYDTRPWYTFGEGPTNEIPHKVIESPYTQKDFRFTTKGDFLYVFVLGWPGNNKEILIKTLSPGNYRLGKIKSLSMLGYNGNIQWKETVRGLVVKMPEQKPCSFAYVLKLKIEDK